MKNGRCVGIGSVFRFQFFLNLRVESGDAQIDGDKIAAGRLLDDRGLFVIVSTDVVREERRPAPCFLLLGREALFWDHADTPFAGRVDARSVLGDGSPSDRCTERGQRQPKDSGAFQIHTRYLL